MRRIVLGLLSVKGACGAPVVGMGRAAEAWPPYPMVTRKAQRRGANGYGIAGS